MNTTRLLLVTLLAALLALPTITAQDGGRERSFTVYLHENPLHIAPPQINVDVGDTVTLQIENFNDNPHDLVVCGDPPNAGSSECSDRWGFAYLEPQSTGQLTFTAQEAGTFEYFCSIPGHKQGGMRGTLVVAGADSEEQKSVPVPAAGLALLALVGVAALRRTLRG